MNNYRVQKVLKKHKKFKKNIKGGNLANYRNDVNNNDNKKKREGQTWINYLFDVEENLLTTIAFLGFITVQYIGAIGNDFVAFVIGTLALIFINWIVIKLKYEKNMNTSFLLFTAIGCLINLIYSSVKFSNISNSDAELNNDLRNKKGINLAGIIISCIGIGFMIFFYVRNRITNSTTTIQN